MGDSAADKNCGAVLEGRETAEAEQKKRKPEEGSQNFETDNGHAKKLKTDGNIPNANDCVTEEHNGNRSGVPGREVQGEEGTIGSMRVAITPVGYPDVKMTEEQAEMVETELVERINTSEEGEPIQFSSMQYENGALVLTCVNKATKQWLHKTVWNMVPWPGANLMSGVGARVTLWLMNGMQTRTSNEILDFIQKQNRGIFTSKWKVRRRKGLSKGHKLIIFVDNKSYEDLAARNFELFLGLYQFSVMMQSEWMKPTGNLGVGKQTAIENQPQSPENNVPHRPATSGFTSQSIPRPLPDSCSRAERQSPRGPGLSSPNPHPRTSRLGRQDRWQHRELEFADTHSLHSRKAKVTSPDRLSPRERTSTEFTTLRNFKSRVPASEWVCEHRIGTSERSKSRKAGYVSPDRVLHRDSVYFSDRPQRNQYSPSDRRQPSETGYTVLDPFQYREMRFNALNQLSSREAGNTVSGQLSPQEMRNTASGQLSPQKTMYTNIGRLSSRERNMASDKLSCRETRHIAMDRLNLDQSEKPRFRSLDRPPSRSSGFKGLDHLPSQESRLRGSDQKQLSEGRFMGKDPLYTASDGAQSRAFTCVPPNLASEYITLNLNRSERLRFRDLSPSHGSRFRGLDELSLQKSRFIDSNQKQPSEGRFVEKDPLYIASDQAQSHISTYAASNKAQSRDSKKTLELNWSENPRFGNLGQLPSHGSRSGVLDGSSLQESRLRGSDEQLLSKGRLMGKDPLYIVNQAQSRSSRYVPHNLTESQDSKYAPPNLDQSKNTTFVGSDGPHFLASRFGGSYEPPSQKSVFRGSDQLQPIEGRFVEQVPLYSRAPRVTMSDPSQYSKFEKTVPHNPHSRDDRFSGSDLPSQQPMSFYTRRTRSHVLGPSD